MSGPQVQPERKPGPQRIGPPPQLAEAVRKLRGRAQPPSTTAAPRAPSRSNVAMLLRTWHKRLGIFAFIFMGWLGFSGFLINQSPSWNYDTKKLYWPWVMSLYGLHPEPPAQGFSAGGHWLAESMDATLLDGKPLTLRLSKQLGLAVGGTADKPLLFVAEPNRVVILTADGGIVDEMSGYTLPVPALRRIGVIPGKPTRVVIQDLDAYATTDGLSWDKLPVNADVQWSAAEALPEAQRSKALPYSRPSVTIEHVLVDAHSGHIFGRWGVWLINVVGFAAIGLSISGIWMTWRISRQRRQASR